ncbi:MAG: M48 family metalloprotease [Proteobacteria bacterium]|nr:M48 family metalloprotease [Pseudomonadota bacterium]
MRRLLPILAAVLLTLTGAAFADQDNRAVVLSTPMAGADLPDLGSPASQMLSQSDEYRLGAMVARQLRDQGALIEDPETVEYLQGMGMRLAAQSTMGGQGFQFFLVRDQSINAFAVPGGYVFVHAGLILATTAESELAGVLGHEIAHVTQHHVARRIRAQSQQSLATAAAMLAAILLGAMGGGQAIEGGIVAAQGLAAQAQINFSRENEIEADRVGIGYLAGAGYDPNAMGSFFELMSRHEGLATTYIPAMLIDHPMSRDRVAEARARAAQFPPRTGKDSQSYELIRERVRVITATADNDLARMYANKVAKGDHSLGTLYGEALALTAANRGDEAAAILAPLVQQHQGLTLLHTALGQAQQKAGHTREAVATLRHAEELFPRNVPVTVRYGEALMAAGRPMDAHNLLLDLFNNVPPTPEQIRLTALAASAAGDAGDAYFYMGEYQVAGGDLMLAAQQYQLALAAPHISSIQRQRYQARLDEVRDFLASQRKRQSLDAQGQGRGGG